MGFIVHVRFHPVAGGGVTLPFGPGLSMKAKPKVAGRSG
jgi:hypothetical protein